MATKKPNPFAKPAAGAKCAMCSATKPAGKKCSACEASKGKPAKKGMK